MQRSHTLARYWNIIQASTAKNYLESHGIPCEIVGGVDNAAVGELSGDITAIELLVHDDKSDEAMRLLRELAEHNAIDPTSSWQCACGEMVPGNFDICWSCKQDRDSASPTDSPDDDSDDIDPANHDSAHRLPLCNSTYVESIIDRAWKASLIGILLLPPLLNFYSMYLLLAYCGNDAQISDKHKRRFAWTLFVNFVVIGTVLSGLFYISRNSTQPTGELQFWNVKFEIDS